MKRLLLISGLALFFTGCATTDYVGVSTSYGSSSGSSIYYHTSPNSSIRHYNHSSGRLYYDPVTRRYRHYNYHFSNPHRPIYNYNRGYTRPPVYRHRPIDRRPNTKPPHSTTPRPPINRPPVTSPRPPINRPPVRVNPGHGSSRERIGSTQER